MLRGREIGRLLRARESQGAQRGGEGGLPGPQRDGLHRRYRNCENGRIATVL